MQESCFVVSGYRGFEELLLRKRPMDESIKENLRERQGKPWKSIKGENEEKSGAGAGSPLYIPLYIHFYTRVVFADSV
ncbi:MAG: hypothetical protein D3906_14075 [Candidatus Electrothrix sp. AUS1_2]|nr:hypothetical protein [Candidatus Electrothrix sp. AUS1_2]